MMLTREYKETRTNQNKSFNIKQNQTKIANDVQDMGCQHVIRRNDSLKIRNFLYTRVILNWNSSTTKEEHIIYDVRCQIIIFFRKVRCGLPSHIIIYSFVSKILYQKVSQFRRVVLSWLVEWRLIYIHTFHGSWLLCIIY